MKLNYKTFGNGEPLIILHGLLGSLDNWQTIAKKLSEEYTVFIVDQRNHGRSPHSDDFSYDLLAADLLEFMYEHHIFNAHVLGHSMGGKVAMKFAVEHSDMVNKLIVADIAPVEYPAGHDIIFESLMAVDLKSVESRQEVEAILEQKIKDFGVRQFLMKGLTRNENNGFTWKFNLKALWNHYNEILKTFDTRQTFEKPALFIKGGKSRYVTDEYIPVINRCFPKNSIFTIEDAGHWLHAEQPEIFTKATLDFLNQSNI
jgi:esterase